MDDVAGSMEQLMAVAQDKDAFARMVEEAAAGQDLAGRTLPAELDDVLRVPGASHRQIALTQEANRKGLVPWLVYPITAVAIKAVRQLAEERGEDPYEALGQLLR